MGDDYDPRIGEQIKQGDTGDVVLVGFPFDEGLFLMKSALMMQGVRRNGGRVGAAEGPNAVRGYGIVHSINLIFSYLQRLGTAINLEYGVDLRFFKTSAQCDDDLHRSITIADFGNIPGSGEDLEEGHKQLTRAVATICAKGGIPFVVGGGNDQSYPNACGALASNLVYTRTAPMCYADDSGSRMDWL